MAAIDYLKDHGFDAKVRGNRLVVSPSSKLTKEQRHYIKLHRLELMAEIAANDGEARRTCWTAVITGHGPRQMIFDRPVTRAEALVDASGRGCWPDVEVR
ncbi:hypothetical protein NA643_15375 [Pseudomonas stutzeri]|uniref:hypothetical protein n=1 Tax=Stutzerimonas stutzeri TaxID=316 RepID=UPI000C9A4D16|nr:hypothetical protein [Stutzerimonas stutzeri]MCQ4280474.1 hypothetical protein [Stutzerimonas stutzeri]PNF71515.1 hypothetical protein CXK96_16895 [Stutzerimonas stutzeri]